MDSERPIKPIPLTAIESMSYSYISSEDIKVLDRPESYNLDKLYGGSEINPERIVHFRWNPINNSAFGFGIIHYWMKPIVKSLEQRKEEYESRKNEIEAYTALREKGVDDETIFRWKSIIEKTKLNPKVIEEELKTNSNLKHIEDDAKKRIEDLKNQEKTLKERVSTLESKRQEIESAINAVKDSGITLIKKISDTLTSKIEETSNRAETISMQSSVLRTPSQTTII